MSIWAKKPFQQEGRKQAVEMPVEPPKKPEPKPTIRKPRTVEKIKPVPRKAAPVKKQQPAPAPKRELRQILERQVDLDLWGGNTAELLPRITVTPQGLRFVGTKKEFSALVEKLAA